ncbi:MFS transporter [Afipia sp. Root123D2]|uniref:YbfB/YjiJ family MFS transporter n=1 Tax=Afipia sp. Root123D2 TaxID=1736436 RepID=UPI0006FA92A2|nr:YbfB/YjiJ family MFS transporter [Afipia sp. Root123D2]KQW19691.1 MFS transporter [Afipia sp. Root123D2]
MSAPENSSPPQAHALRTILVLALAPAIGLGIGRFAYSLVLPDMRDALGWSYATAGFMNTINAAGYLAGALGAAAFIRRYGLFAAVWVGTVACVISLALCAITGNVIVFSFARLLAGLGAAIAFIAGGAMAAAIAQSRPAQSAILLGLFYTGPALGIIISGLAAPFLLEGFGPGSWWIVWTAVTAISTILTVPLLITRVDAPPFKSTSTSNAVPLRPILAYLAGYFLFGAGYIAYMTFMIAYIRDAGGSAAAQSGFWCLIGLSSFVSPWAWRRLMTRGDSGMTTGILIGITAIGTGLALFGTAPALLAASAFVFGTAFFAVVTATTVFTRINYPPASWPKVIGILTVAFGLGQTFGPIATGAITDAMGSLTYALNVSAAALALGALACACQRRLVTSGLAS